MATAFKKTLLFLGDILVFYLALFLMLYLRYADAWANEWQHHLYPFAIIYISWLLVFYLIGLYENPLFEKVLSTFRFAI